MTATTGTGCKSNNKNNLEMFKKYTKYTVESYSGLCEKV